VKEYLLAALTSFVFSFFLCIAEIPLLKRLKAGQNILKYVKEHEGKQGTPTMGGLAFVVASVFAALLFCGVSSRALLVSVVVGLGFAAVGFLDDFLKMKHKENLGLTPVQKIVFQTAVALLACAYCFLNGKTALNIPFTSLSLDIGWGIFPLGLFVFLATVNGVNLTDGLDGLAGASCAGYFLCMGVLILLQGGESTLTELSFCLTAALFAYLVFNTNKASVFMGDTGSLSLGGFAACIAIFSGNMLYIALMGITFVLSVITVIVQVIYYKKTGKRVFRMAPVHHHFQQAGYSESKIAYCYWLVTVVVGVLCLLPLL
jgi:phospho-N-acetylmuramoyl-pentapeptide-transferase